MYKVLLVDDENTILEGLSILIDWERYGLQISNKASDGQKAIEILESTEIHILITDIKMPNLGGLDLIRYLRNKKSNIKCIVLSGYDDFIFVKEAARLGIENYILKPVDENELIQTLISTVEKLENEMYESLKTDKGLQMLRENILNRWIAGNISENELDERLAFSGINRISPYYAVSVLKVFCKTSISPDNYNYVKLLLYDICKSKIDKRIHRDVFFDQYENIVIIYFFNTSDDEYNKSLIYTSLNRCMDSCNEIYENVSFYAATSSFVNKSKMVNESYLHAAELILYGLLPVKERVVFYDDMKIQREDDNKYLENDLILLERFLQLKDIKSTLQFIDKLYDKFQKAGLDGKAAQNITISLLYNIIKIIENPIMNNGLLLTSYQGMFGNFRNIVSLEALNKLVKLVISKRLDSHASKKRSANPIIDKMLNCIYNKYNMNINLNTISEELGMNHVYLGSLFKNETGMRFSDFHNNYRIKKAKELLAESNLKTNDIMERVGYVNLSYFYTMFKKIAGLSVAEFKQKVIDSEYHSLTQTSQQPNPKRHY